MQAVHPRTGNPIKIINSEASVWRDQKTLVWLDAAGPVPASMSRWDVGATSLAALRTATEAGVTPDIVVCVPNKLTTQVDWAEWLGRGGWSDARLVAVPKDLIEFIGMDRLAKMRITNLICLDEMAELYPFTGPKWDGSTEDAKALLALALRFHQTFPCMPSAERAAILDSVGLKATAEFKAPPPLWLIGQYYRPSKGRRAKEINACLQKNLECPYVDRVVLLNEEACAPEHPKIQEVVIGSRLTYGDVLRYIQSSVPADTIVAFANSDIFLDESWRSLWSVNLAQKFLALLRWDVAGVDEESVKAAQLFGPRPDSQDTWVTWSTSIQAMKIPSSPGPFDFPFGKGGCDNAITLEMFKNRFVVANPALTLKTYHFHTSQVRNYDPVDVVDKPAFLYISPTGLHDMRPIMDLKPTVKESLTFSAFDRRLEGPSTPAQLRTFCSMIKRKTQEEMILDPAGPNTWTPPAVPLSSLKGVFQTRDGLVYTYDSLLVGKTKASAEAWAKSELSSMAASLTVAQAAVAPLPEVVASDPAAYVLQYLSKILLMRKLLPSAEFWCSRKESCVEALKAFRWPAGEIPVLSREDNLQTWCKEAMMWPYQDVPGGLVSREEVAALREAFALGGWVPKPEGGNGKRIVVMCDETVITDAFVEGLEKVLGADFSVEVLWPKTSLDLVLHSLKGAWGLITASSSAAKAWSWVLPAGAGVWEIQSEMDPDVELWHLAAAAELKHRLVITPKGVLGLTALDRILGSIRQDLGAAVAPQPPAAAKRRLFLPTQRKGFFAHAGDSFREMARLWAERGYVDVVDAATSQIWLDGPGKILLYDRPTMEWLRTAPPSEQTWQYALFGNPAPPKDKPASPWIFWPRRPALVEAAVARGLADTPFEQRKGLVFYGRSENAIQEDRRSRHNWAPACDEFVHVAGESKYPFTQEEYLEKLAAARFGLCLAGFGLKCHREVECMAMGCVPIVAPEVDMTSYAEPPQEGIHFFRAQTPEAAAAAVAATGPEIWAAMSAACKAWWQRNASVEGSWRTTERLSAAAPAAEA